MSAPPAERTRDPRITSRIMAAVRARNTEPEWLLRRALFKRGLRFRVHVKALPGRPDIVFSGARVAVFVDGDFWHGAGWRERGFTSMEAQFVGRQRADFWITKIKANMRRDEQVNAALTEQGWRVIRLWESHIRKSPGRCVARVLRSISGQERTR